MKVSSLLGRNDIVTEEGLELVSRTVREVKDVTRAALTRFDRPCPQEGEGKTIV